MKTLLLILIFPFYLFSSTIMHTIIACPTLQDIQHLEPYIDSDSNKIFIKEGCLILTPHANIKVTKVIQDRYLEIFVDDLGVFMFTLKRFINVKNPKTHL